MKLLVKCKAIVDAYSEYCTFLSEHGQASVTCVRVTDIDLVTVSAGPR